MIPPELVADGHAPCLVWRLPAAVRAASSAPLGGGLVDVGWVVSCQVSRDYAHPDPAADLARRARALGLTEPEHGVGFLTAADLSEAVTADDEGVRVDATVGLAVPTWAAGPPGPGSGGPHSAGSRPAGHAGTINVVVQVPEALADGALVNAIATVAEAKAQALAELGVAGTGTASDAACVLCPATGPADRWGGPRSRWGSPIARAVHAAVTEGAAPWA